jgi:hypothetical protein
VLEKTPGRGARMMNDIPKTSVPKSTVISLNQARKAKRQSAKQVTAAANRTKFGRTKAEKQNDAALEQKRQTLLDGAERETPRAKD